MSILFSGDFCTNYRNKHENLSLITRKNLIKKYDHEIFKTIKYHVILGDCGFLLPGNYKTDLFNYKSLARRENIRILCVLGDKDPTLDILSKKNIPEVDIGIGETVYQIHDKPFIAYLKRGKVYNIDGFKCLVLGGALCADKEFRIQNKTWYKNEHWTEQEKHDLFKLLETEKDFDLVISHTAPYHMNEMFFSYEKYSEKLNDEVALMNDEIHKIINFKEWWCGHWHIDLIHNEANRKYYYLYNRTYIKNKVEGWDENNNEFLYQAGEILSNLLI
jgi:3-oxoacid CoA-transferase subunit A